MERRYMLYHQVLLILCSVLVIISMMLGLVAAKEDNDMRFLLFFIPLAALFVLVVRDEGNIIDTLRFGEVMQSSRIPSNVHLKISSEVMLLRGPDGHTYVIQRNAIPDSLRCELNQVVIRHDRSLSGEKLTMVDGTACARRTAEKPNG